jgi:hypothetical protein
VPSVARGVPRRFLFPTLQVVRAAIALLAVFAFVPPATAAPCRQLCPSGQDPCTVSVNLTCDSPANFDLGVRSLVIKQGKSLTVSGGDGGGSLTLAAGSVTLESGAMIQANGAANGGTGTVAMTSAGLVSLGAGSQINVSPADGTLDLTAGSLSLAAMAAIHVTDAQGESGELVVTSAGAVSLATGSLIDVGVSSDGGSIDIEAQSGDILAFGSLVASASKGDGGDVALAADAGGITIGGDQGIDVSGGGDFSGGGSVELDATGDVSIDAPVALSGGDGGELDVDSIIDSGGSVVSSSTGTIDLTAKDAGGIGGLVSIGTGGDVTLAGAVMAPAPKGNDLDGGGLGGELAVTTTGSGSVEIDGDVDVSGSGPDGGGGGVDVVAGTDLTLSGSLLGGSDGGGSGGAVTMSAGRHGSIASTIDLGAADAGGAITITSTGLLDILGTLLVDATGHGGGVGGQTLLQACTLNLVRGATVSATGAVVFPNDASNVLRASGQMTINGSLQASNHNRLEFRDTAPTIGPFATMNPAPDLLQNPALPCCEDACAPSSTTTTSTSTSTTSSTGHATSTTTTLASPTSTAATTTLPQGSSTSTSTTSAYPTTTSPGTTPTTVPPPSCLDDSSATFDVVDCRLRMVSAMLQSQSTDALGGAKSARALTARIAQASRLITIARTKNKPTATLRRAKLALGGFRLLARRGIRRHRIDGGFGGQVLQLTSGIVDLVDSLQRVRTGEAGTGAASYR